ncbi:unnamed protein product [Nezara viridula]|uniref:Uncharacterized protein n=1 Tax=Nezara viridula TaxID=85310 RepID=A0A9P0HKG8_NEZVI|nr:unnamed protein product [Nezara viridula]
MTNVCVQPEITQQYCNKPAGDDSRYPSGIDDNKGEKNSTVLR